ncbi:MAG: hypothetical protein ACLP19_04355 [Xanthobacteraceae bacterium]
MGRPYLKPRANDAQPLSRYLDILARAVADGRFTLDAGDGFSVEPPKG